MRIGHIKFSNNLRACDGVGGWCKEPISYYIHEEAFGLDEHYYCEDHFVERLSTDPKAAAWAIRCLLRAVPEL